MSKALLTMRNLLLQKLQLMENNRAQLTKILKLLFVWHTFYSVSMLSYLVICLDLKSVFFKFSVLGNHYTVFVRPLFCIYP